MSEKAVTGDLSGLELPATPETLVAAGAEWLTRACHASGALADDQRVMAITSAEPFFGGGTGSKMRLGVTWSFGQTGLPTQLFIKFSRNFDDPMRDYSRQMMVSEVKFAALSRKPGFPITVPLCLFADIHAESGTGLMITECLPYGENGVEPQYQKCMDYEVPHPLEHYRAIIKALAQLAGAHKVGRLDPAFDSEMRFDREQILAADAIRYSPEKLQRRASRIVAFIQAHPRLFPENLCKPEFGEQFLAQMPMVAELEWPIKHWLYSNPDYVALCHWNANLDNGWYWRDKQGDLQCGLMDWGRVGQMSVAQAIYGALSGAEVELWNLHFDELLGDFVREYEMAGGPALEVSELRNHVALVTATMGLAWLMDAPAIIERDIADTETLSGIHDDRLKSAEDARVQLHMLTMFLNQWQVHDIGALVTRLGF